MQQYCFQQAPLLGLFPYKHVAAKASALDALACLSGWLCKHVKPSAELRYQFYLSKEFKWLH